VTGTALRLPPAPPLLLSGALMLWGWQNGLLPYAAPMAIVLELARFVNWRWPVSDREMNNVSDLCSVILFVVAMYLFTDKGARGIFTLLSLVPFILYPLVLVQLYSERGRVRLSALFVSLRRPGAQRFPEALEDTDLTLGYFAACLVSASAGNLQRLLFFGMLCALVAALLWYTRPRRYPAWLWGGALCCAMALGYAGQLGMMRLQALAEAGVIELLDRFMWRYRDPDMATTAIGSLGRLKLSDRIVLRVRSDTPLRGTLLLREAGYDTYGYGIWSNRQRAFQTLDPEPGGRSWRLSDASPASRVSIATYMIRQESVIALPHGSVRVRSAEATAVSRNPMGAVRMEVREGWIRYAAEFGAAAPPDSAPTAADLFVSDSNRPDFDRLAGELGLGGMEPARAVAAVERHFASKFTYSLSPRQRYPRAGYLSDFLFESSSGHCEFFATSTVLLLRAAGIPARYAVGYAVDEYSGLESGYVARARDAHSWAMVWVDGAWRTVDTTPPSWAAFEDQQASGLQGLADFWSFLSFRLARLGAKDAEEEEADYSALLWLLIPLLSLLAWRLYFKERVARTGPATGTQRLPVETSGRDSPLYRLVIALEARVGARTPGETLASWLVRVCHNLGLRSPDTAVRLHYRYRFDPRGINTQERGALDAAVQQMLDGMQRLTG
jgi:hypothetical protein